MIDDRAADVSVIIPAHRSTDPYMAETLRSVAEQTVQPLEILVVRDVHDEGPAVIRNRAAAKASGKWLLLLDADDTIDPRFIEIAIAKITTTQCDVVALSDVPLTEVIYQDNYIPYCALISNAAWRWLGGHQEPSTLGHGLCDWDFWIRCWIDRSVIRVGYIDPWLFHHRDREGSMSKWPMDHFEKMRADLWRKYGVHQ